MLFTEQEGRMMTNWKSLVRKRVLVRIGWTMIVERTVEEVSKSGQYIKMDEDWYKTSSVSFIEALD